MSNEPAFPTTPQHNGYGPDALGPGYGASVGMSLRDYFAAAALPAVIRTAEDAYANGQRDDNPPGIKEFAFDAYHIADAMLAEREKRSGAGGEGVNAELLAACKAFSAGMRKGEKVRLLDLIEALQLADAAIARATT